MPKKPVMEETGEGEDEGWEKSDKVMLAKMKRPEVDEFDECRMSIQTQTI